MGKDPLGFQIVATTDEGTRCALRAATNLANGSDARVLLLVPHVIRLFQPANRHDAILITDRYRAIARDVGVDALVRLCVCRRVDDMFRWMLGPGARIVIGGRQRRWWPSAAQRMARRLEALGHDVVFATV
jgi:hypothetical protein